MPWFKFDKDFDHRANARSVIAYKKAQHLLIPQAHADAAASAGKGSETEHAPQSGDAKDGTQTIRTGDKIAVPQTKG